MDEIKGVDFSTRGVPPRFVDGVMYTQEEWEARKARTIKRRKSVKRQLAKKLPDKTQPERPLAETRSFERRKIVARTKFERLLFSRLRIVAKKNSEQLLSNRRNFSALRKNIANTFGTKRIGDRVSS